MTFFSGLLALSFILHSNEAKQTQLLESLQCINDYKSFVSCTWSESQDVQKLIKMNLLYNDHWRKGFKRMNCVSPNMDSQSWKWSCYRNQSFFGALIKEYYTFKPDRNLEVQMNISLFDNVQLPPPEELDISLTEEGDFLLTWKAGGGANGSHWLDEELEYQVAYKREWEPWERSTSVFASNFSRCLIHRDQLVPGSTYVARVRSKPHQSSRLSGGYSDWSSAVNWTAQEGDEAQPKNLRCLFNGLDLLTCSWEVRRELTGSVSFALFYKTSPGSSETQCSPAEEEELPGTPHVLQSCKILVTDPKRLSQYLVTVRPKEDEKIIAPVYNIKLEPPYELSVTKLKNWLYKLQWKEKEHKCPRMNQVLYWAVGKMPERVHCQNISEDVPQFTFDFQSLEPGSRYKAKIRAKAHTGAYDGPWSEWSEEYEWETESDLPFWGFALAVPVFIILAIAGMYCIRRCLLRKKKEWEKSIPRPPNTFLLPGYFQKVQLPDSFEGSSSLEKEVDSNNALDRPILVTCSNSFGTRSGKRPSDVFQNTERTEFPKVKLDQSLRHAESSSTLAHSHNAEVGLAQPVFDFNGPYLMSCQESAVGDVQQVVAPLEMRETPALNGPYLMSCQESAVPDVQEVVATSEMREKPVLMQYVELPHGSCFQVFPMGKGKGIIPPFCTIHSEGEEKLPLSGRKQEVSEGQLPSCVLEKVESKGQRPPNPTNNNNLRNGILDYFTTEELSRKTERGSSLLSPIVALKEEMFTCATIETCASQLTQTINDPSSSESYQKTTNTVLPPEDQALAIPSETSQDVFGQYFITLPGTLKSMPKERQASFTKDPGQSFLVFSPDGKSPIFLSQVGDYCFFPSTKPVTETQEGCMGHRLGEDSHSLTKQPCETKFVQSEPKAISHICQVRDGAFVTKSTVSV
ncbi:cytokine receptor common subunit beta [Paroedura picta]|uniref:cytokine receptor common subunit beta n=1 Tax=Paroedura picta TaxID=143630 RepID=UPI004055FCEA